MKQFPGILTRSDRNGRPYIITDEQREWLCKWFPVTENKRLMKASGMTHAMLHRLARRYGLTKSEKGLRAIKKRQAAHIKRLCTKNGYYASLKGRKPTKAMLEGTQRMWQDIREGKREHPYQVMRRKHPRKYKEYMKRKSEQRKEIIRKEVIRMKWGMPRKTNLHVAVMQPYRRSQILHRYNAAKYGYILADTCLEGSGHRFVIYYDDNTPRRRIFERNCIRDGFRFERWQDIIQS